MAEYKANRSVIAVGSLTGNGGVHAVAIFSVAPELEDATANSLSPDRLDRELSAIEWKVGKYLRSHTADLTAETRQISGHSRPEAEINLENCIQVVLGALKTQWEL